MQQIVMGNSVNQIIRLLWTAMFVVWLFTGLKLKRTMQSQSEGISRLAVYIVWAGWWLLFSHGFGKAPLSNKVFEPPLLTADIGLAITALGLAFAVVARLYIGTNWSALIQVKEGHELIQTGPYAVVRHPIFLW